MSKELANFFADLSANPLLMEKFEADPSAILAASGLSQTEKQFVMSRDPDQVPEHWMMSNRIGTTHKKKTAKKKGTKKK
jgi:hypothetical protein